MPPRARASVTLHDVARVAGVSLATASRVLSGTRPVSASLRRRVLDAVAELHYVADANARAMRGGTGSIALLADDLTTPALALMTRGMEREARGTGVIVTASSTGGTPAGQLATFRAVRAMRPTAIVLTSSRIVSTAGGDELLAELDDYEAEGGRVVLIGDTELPFPSIAFDNRAAAATIGRFVADAGYRDVGIVTGTAGHSVAEDRSAGFRSGLGAGGVDAERIAVAHAAWTRDGGHDAAIELVRSARSSGRPLGAILAASDVLAIGVLSGLRSLGIAVPAGIAVTGIDDLPVVRDLTPRLTTLAMPLEDAGRRALRLAIAAEQPPRTASSIRGELRVRESLPLAVDAPARGVRLRAAS